MQHDNLGAAQTGRRLMTPPETRYARSGNVRIAYQILGNGPFDLVFVPVYVSNMDLYWEGPAWSDFFSRLAFFSRLLLFDKRGTGLSDRMAGIATLEERMDDVRAVMDAAGSEKAALYGVSEGGPMALLFAATYPERTRALVLYGSFACHPSTLTAENIGEHIATIDRAWGTGEYTAEGFCARTAADETFRRALGRFERQGASPSAAATIVRMQFETDARHVLSTIRIPTLVLHRVGD